MKRWALVVLVGFSSCAGFRAVERGEWRRVYTKDAASVRDLEAPQEVISREKYEDELANDVRRAVMAGPGWTAPWLSDVEVLALAVREVLELRVDEARPVELHVKGSAAEVFWGPRLKRDEWKDGSDVTHHESTLFVRGLSKGALVLRLISVEGQRDVPVTVK